VKLGGWSVFFKGNSRPFSVFPSFCFSPFHLLQPYPQAANQTVPCLQFYPEPGVDSLEEATAKDFKKALFGKTCRLDFPPPFITGSPFEMPGWASGRELAIEPGP
jgi:hypothetical protein